MRSLLNALDHLVACLRYLMSRIVILLFLIMMGAVLVQVGGRYVFNYSISTATELATFSQIWLVLLGSGIAMARNQHVAIDILPAQLSLNLQRVASVAIAIITLAFLAVLAYGSLPLLRLGAIQTSSAMRLPMWWVYLCLPVGAFYISLELVVATIRTWNNPFGSRDAHEEDVAS